MPQVQVLSTEKDYRNPVQDHIDNIKKQQELNNDTYYKHAMISYQKEMAKIESKKAASEVEKYRLENEARKWEKAEKVMKLADNYATDENGNIDKEKWEKYLIAVTMDEPDLMDVFGNKKLQDLAPPRMAPDQYKDLTGGRKNLAEAGYMGTSADFLNQQLGGRGNAPGSASSAPGESGGMQPTQESRSGALGGGGFVPTGYSAGPNGVTLSGSSPKNETLIEAAKQAGRPLSENEAGVVSKAEMIPPIIDEMIAILAPEGPTKNAYGPVPFGANRIKAFGEKGPIQGILRGLTVGKGRELGLKLQKIKILAFGEGGKTLSENERDIVFAALNPTGKTEKQWIEDLDFAKRTLERKAELMTKPRGITKGGAATNYIRTGTNKQGQRVGMRSDGSVEVINE